VQMNGVEMPIQSVYPTLNISFWDTGLENLKAQKSKHMKNQLRALKTHQDCTCHQFQKNFYIPLFLWHPRMYADGWEVTFHKQFVQLCSSANTLDKNNYLVEVQSVKKIIQLPVLLCLLQFDVVLKKVTNWVE